MTTQMSAAGRCSLMLVALASCGHAEISTGSDPSPALILQDSIELQEPGSVPLGKPGTLLALNDGGYLVADLMIQRLLEYDAQGNARRVIGRKGSGPGEFQRLGPVALDGDSVLYVLDGTMLNVLDYRTGEYRERALLPAPMSQSIAARDGRLYFRALDSTQTPHMSAWGTAGIAQGPALPAASELETVKAAGAEATARMMNSSHSWAVFTALGADSVAVLSQSSEDVLIGSLAGIVQRLPVARAQREGVRADLIAKIAADPSVVQSDPQLAYTPSIPVAVAQDVAGRFASIRQDFTFLTDHFSAKLYLSVTDPNTGLTCPDARVPGPEDPAPSVAMRGDTLFVLSQEVRGATAVTVIRKYLVRTAECKWVGPTAM